MSEMVYCHMLVDALNKKIDLLKLLLVRNKEQLAILQNSDSTSQDLEDNVALKQELIDAIASLDRGFELVFARIKDTIMEDTICYGDTILKLQELIRQVTDLSAQVETSEAYNRDIAKARFASSPVSHTVKKSSAAVSQYYKSMMEAAKRDSSKTIDRLK